MSWAVPVLCVYLFGEFWDCLNGPSAAKADMTGQIVRPPPLRRPDRAPALLIAAVLRATRSSSG